VFEKTPINQLFIKQLYKTGTTYDYNQLTIFDLYPDSSEKKYKPKIIHLGI